MRNIWRIFRDDVRFATSNVISVLVLLGLCLVPVMYAWFNIAGSWDPYAKTGNLKVAVANCDEGFESDLVPIKANIGDRVIDQLYENDEYGWVFVGEDNALEGVKSGEYYAAIVIPSDFSRQMMTVFSTDADQASVDFYLNLKENPVAPLLVGEGDAEALEDIRVKFTEAVDEMTLELASDFASFIDSGNMQNFGARLSESLEGVATGLDAMSDQVRSLSSLTDTTSSIMETGAKTLSGSGDVSDVAGGIVADAAEDLDAAIESAQSAASEISQQVRSARSRGDLGNISDEEAADLASDIAALASSVERISQRSEEASKSLQESLDSFSGSTDSLVSDLNKARNALGTAANKLGASASKIRKFKDDVAVAIARNDIDTIARIVGSDPTNLSQWLSSPVNIERHAIHPIENYGSSMAPFYTALSMWAGALILVALLKVGVSRGRVSRYEEESGRPVRKFEQYLGRYGIFVALSLLQATVVGLGDIFFLRVQCVHPVLFLVACWVCALVFSNIVYTLAASFGAVGKALGVIMLVIQVAGSGGEYPVQMMGDFFQVIYPLMPFTYGMHAMQASIAGIFGMEYLFDLGILLVFLVPSFILGIAIRRPIQKTDFML